MEHLATRPIRLHHVECGLHTGAGLHHLTSRGSTPCAMNWCVGILANIRTFQVAQMVPTAEFPSPGPNHTVKQLASVKKIVDSQESDRKQGERETERERGMTYKGWGAPVRSNPMGSIKKRTRGHSNSLPFPPYRSFRESLNAFSIS